LYPISAGAKLWLASEWEALRLKGLAIGTFCILAADFAQAGSLQVAGSTGYASEWTLEGEVTQIGTTEQFAGPVAFTHAGLCTVSGPPVRSSQIKFEISRSGSSSKIQAFILYEGAWCAYSGKLSGLSSRGFMRCSETDQIPITLTIK
jgi:hypothetical protein